jgi:predicted metal-dependent phosphoesterase TrpH
MRIDLHVHSTASDGTESPAALAAAAQAAGLDVIALTDHDTTHGVAAAAASAPAGVTVLPGVELSCRWPTGAAAPSPDPAGAGLLANGPGVSLHLLGYLVDPAAPELLAACRQLRAGRVDRGRQMADRMVAAGLPISWPQVAALAGAGSVGRPHLAQALVRAGVVPTVEVAFREYLHPGSPYFAGKTELDAVAAIGLVRRCGGVPVFAHPLARRRGRVVDDDAIAAMAAAGLAGLEVDHPDHDEAERGHLRHLAADLRLLVTGASDYHGTNKPVPLGAHTTDPAVYHAIRAAADSAAAGPAGPDRGRPGPTAAPPA